MDRVTLDFSLPNFITIGLIAAFWWIVYVAIMATLGSKGTSNA